MRHSDEVPARRPGGRPSVSRLLPVLSFVVFSFEIALTRIFGYLFSYELIPVAVAIALFGLGSGAWLRQTFLAGWDAPVLHAGGLLLLGVAFLGLYPLILLTADPAALLAAVVLVFVVCGALVSSCYEGSGERSASLSYALDLAGGALGCLAVVPLLDVLGPLGVVFLLSCLCAAAAAAVAWESGRERRFALAAGMLALIALAGLAWQRSLPDALVESRMGADKPLKTFLQQSGGRVADHEWSVIGRADLYEPSPSATARLIFSDGGNPSLMIQEPRTPAETAAARRWIQYLPLSLSRPRRMLILGSGGGVEVTLARIAGVEQVDAVELSPAVVDLVRRWRGFAGPVYDRPGVKVFAEEGRRFLESRPARYDLIQMTLVVSDSTDLGTYTQPDGHLYTLEAYRLYLHRLSPEGMLAVVDDSERRMTKHFLTALAALRESEGTDAAAARHLMVSENPNDPAHRYLLLASPTPFSGPRLQTALLALTLSGSQPLWMPGWTAPQEPYASILREGAGPFIAASTLDLKVRSDNSPYPFHFAKGLRNTLASLRPLLVIGGASALLGILLAWRSGRAPEIRKAAFAGWLLGIGFMVLEIGLLQKLGLAVAGPSQTLAVLLFSLLLWCGLGSRLAGAATSRWGLGTGACCVLVGLVGMATALSLDGAWILARVASPGLRSLCAALALAPIGVVLGTPFPTLLRISGARDRRLLGLLWGLSGLGSVTGALLAMTGALLLGIRETVFLASALYLVTAWIVR